MIGSLLGWLCGTVAAVLASVFVVAVVRHNLRVRRVRRTYQALPDGIEEQVLQLIQNAAKGCPSVTFLRLDNKRTCNGNDELLQSHVGGVPYAEAGEEWPTDSPAKFLLQVRLDERGLGQQWQGRLLTVFLFDFEPVVRCYTAPSLDKYVPLASPLAPLPCIWLTPIRMPVDENREQGDEDDEDPRRFPTTPDQLCRMVPEIRDVLSPFTRDYAGLLAQILRPVVYGYELDTSSIAYIGGDPMLIQNPHDPVCDDCGEPMRFLFQFGEIIPGVQLGDAGVCYVYGCDNHPDLCKGFMDSH